MQASAQQQPGLLPPASATFTGTLLHHGEARSMTCDAQGHMVPVLILTLELDGVLHNHLQSQQPFPVGEQIQCEAAAKRYRKGMRVQVQARMSSLRMIAAHTEHVHVLTTTEDHPQ